MEQAIEKYFLEGDEFKPTEMFYDFLNKPGIYIFEVLRVVSGLPLFIDEHLERLRQSVLKSGLNQKIDLTGIKNSVSHLISQNQTQIGNIKIVLRFYRGQFNIWLYFIPYYYPSGKNYTEGVKVGVLHTERTNPEAKTIQSIVKEAANKIINEQNLYEVLLIDAQSNIREGSRSNVFFIKGDQVVTPPTKTVLNGITRQKVVGILSSGRYNFVEEPIAFADLGMFDCLFLTGTSPKVLPVTRVENLKFDPQNFICKTIAEEYDHLIETYLTNHK